MHKLGLFAECKWFGLRGWEPRGQQCMNLNYIGPSIMMFGTDEQKEKYIKPMAAGEVV